MTKIELPVGEFAYDDNGNWLWKAQVPVVKRQAREHPQIAVVSEIEAATLKEFDKAMVNAVRDISRYLV